MLAYVPLTQPQRQQRLFQPLGVRPQSTSEGRLICFFVSLSLLIGVLCPFSSNISRSIQNSTQELSLVLAPVVTVCLGEFGTQRSTGKLYIHDHASDPLVLGSKHTSCSSTRGCALRACSSRAPFRRQVISLLCTEQGRTPHRCLWSCCEGRRSLCQARFSCQKCPGIEIRYTDKAEEYSHPRSGHLRFLYLESKTCR